MATPVGEAAGHEELARAMTEASGLNGAAFLLPWLEETEIPWISTSIEDERGRAPTRVRKLRRVQNCATTPTAARLSDEDSRFSFLGSTVWFYQRM